MGNKNIMYSIPGDDWKDIDDANWGPSDGEIEQYYLELEMELEKLREQEPGGNRDASEEGWIRIPSPDKRTSW